MKVEKIEDQHFETKDNLEIEDTKSSENKSEALGGLIKKVNFWKFGFMIVGVLFLISQLFSVRMLPDAKTALAEFQIGRLKQKVIPETGVTLPVRWNDLGMRMVEVGIINIEKFEELYQYRGGFTEEMEELLYGTDNVNLHITSENAGMLLNLLWAFGLANKNSILENGPMVAKEYGGDASRFASTGGWSLSEGNVMDHYSKYALVTLTQEQQELVERVSKNIYRPCCGNSVYFPDCNHGMAMLGLLQLLVSQGATEKDIYDAALVVNSYWFPDTYLTIAQYMKRKGSDWKDIDAKTVLGYDYSSSGGYRGILAEINPVQQSLGGGSCGV